MRTLEVFGRRVRVEYADGRWTAFDPNAEGKRVPLCAAPIPEFVQSEAELKQYFADLWHEAATPDRSEVRWVD
jgi:hypothetical protein